MPDIIDTVHQLAEHLMTGNGPGVTGMSTRCAASKLARAQNEASEAGSQPDFAIIGLWIAQTRMNTGYWRISSVRYDFPAYQCRGM